MCTTYQLNLTSAFIDPVFLNSIRANNQKATVEEDGSIMLLGQKMVFADSTQVLAPGTPVGVYLNRYIFCFSISEYEKAQQEREAARLVEQAIEKEKRNAKRAEADTFNATLAIPVKWKTGFKDRIQSVSESGYGRIPKNTVVHVFLMESLQVGKLKRLEEDFLCSNSKAKYRARYCIPIIGASDGEGNIYSPKVTCAACLAIVKRLAKKAKPKGGLS